MLRFFRLSSDCALLMRRVECAGSELDRGVFVLVLVQFPFSILDALPNITHTHTKTTDVNK